MLANLLVAYVLSSGPMQLVDAEAFVPASEARTRQIFWSEHPSRQRWDHPLWKLYVPLAWLADETPAGAALNWYWDVFTPDVAVPYRTHGGVI